MHYDESERLEVGSGRSHARGVKDLLQQLVFNRVRQVSASAVPCVYQLEKIHIVLLLLRIT